MDKGAAKSALSGFLIGKNLTANQSVFLDQVVNYLALGRGFEPRYRYQKKLSVKS
jgi:hypothetical protein